MQIKKILFSVLSLFCLCFSFTSFAFADEQPFIDEQLPEEYAIAINPTSNLAVSGNTAYCTSRVDGRNANRIGVLQVLQKWGGFSTGYVDVPHANWIKCVFTNSVYFSNSFSGLSAGTYRVKSVFTLYNASGDREELTIYSSTKTIS